MKLTLLINSAKDVDIVKGSNRTVPDSDLQFIERNKEYKFFIKHYLANKKHTQHNKTKKTGRVHTGSHAKSR